MSNKNNDTFHLKFSRYISPTYNILHLQDKNYKVYNLIDNIETRNKKRISQDPTGYFRIIFLSNGGFYRRFTANTFRLSQTETSKFKSLIAFGESSF